MNRQHARPVMIGANGAAVSLTPIEETTDAVSEYAIQSLIYEHPAALPIADIDPLFAGAIPICLELSTSAGLIDMLMVTPSGLPVLIECKLWRNAQARREVVGQIIDYAKELSRWSAADLDREVRKRRNTSLIDIMRQHRPDVSEAAFNDSVSHNLRVGRFLLLIVGDGIRESVEAIAEYVQRYAGLHFILGLVELPVFVTPDGGRLFAPRIVARTTLITRNVVEAPAGYIVADVSDGDDPEIVGIHPANTERMAFWSEFLAGLKLDDGEQPVPKPSDVGSLSFMMPAPRGSCWLTVYRNVAKGTLGVFLSYSRQSVGEQAVLATLDGIDALGNQLGGDPAITIGKDGRKLLTVSREGFSWTDSSSRGDGIAWLRERTNEFVNVFRPRIRSAVADLAAETNA